MPKSPRKTVEDGLRSSKEIREQIESFTENIKKLEKQLQNARERLEKKKSNSYPDELAISLMEQVRVDAPSVLVNYIEIAVDASREFDHPAYKEALFSVARDEGIYLIRKRGSGWNTTLEVQIVFERTAGTIYDYGRGVSAYRETVLKTRIADDSSNRGLRATNWWLTKVYTTGLQAKTIHGRISASGRRAPFWQLLNSGGTSLSSDRPDGSFNPIDQPATNFINNTERSLVSQFQSAFTSERVRWEREEKELAKYIKETTEEMNRISNKIIELELEGKANKNIFGFFNKITKKVQNNEVEKTVKRTRADKASEKPAKGAGKVKGFFKKVAKRFTDFF